jgi:RNA polymerase sigma-70 factor (ECF subfamily)
VHDSIAKEWKRECESADAPSLRLRDLYREHSAFVWRSLRRLGVADADADDMLQEVFLVVHQRLSEYEERDKVRAWLYAICRRVSSDQRRKTFQRRETMGPDLPEGNVAATQLAHVENLQALRLGHRLLGALSQELQEVFVLFEIEQMPMAQVVEAVGCGLFTGYSRLRLARKKIQSELARARRAGES